MINNKAIDFDRIEKWSIDFQLAKVELDENDQISDYCREGCCHKGLVTYEVFYVQSDYV